MAGTGSRWTRTDQAEWDRMNKENADAARGATGKPVVTRGNTERGQSNGR